MRTVLLSTILLFSTTFLRAQSIVLDSIPLSDYPVKQGAIYKYDPKDNFSQACASSLSIVSVVTSADSVFHFEEGNVSSVFTVDGHYGIIVINPKGESVTYSNLKKVTLRKGDHVRRGMFLGTTARCLMADTGRNQVDILVLRNVKALPYKKTVEYIRNMAGIGRKS